MISLEIKEKSGLVPNYEYRKKLAGYEFITIKKVLAPSTDKT
jgi:hypothetical protein